VLFPEVKTQSDGRVVNAGNLLAGAELAILQEAMENRNITGNCSIVKD
jgi:hypothetical protein